MEEKINEYKRILFLIEDFNTEIKALNRDIHFYNNKISLIDGMINDQIGNLEVNVRILENKRTKIESIINDNKVLGKKIKRYLLSAGVSSLITLTLLLLSSFESHSFIRFLIGISISVSILLISSGCQQLCHFFRNKMIINKNSISALNSNIEDRKREIDKIYCENKSLIDGKEKIEKIIIQKRDIINDMRVKVNHLRHEESKMSKMLLDSIHEEVKDSYYSEIEGQLEIPGVRSYVKKKSR